MNSKSFLMKQLGAVCMLLSTGNQADALKTDQMIAINHKIEELASTMHQAMLESGDQEVSYA